MCVCLPSSTVIVSQPAPDYGTGAREMAWMRDTYEIFRPDDLHGAACVTGKPMDHGGIAGREEATGLGVFFGVEEAMSKADDMEALGLTTGIAGKTFIVQGDVLLTLKCFESKECSASCLWFWCVPPRLSTGFGNVGYWSAVHISRNGGIVTGIIEYNGAIYNEKGAFQCTLRFFASHDMSFNLMILLRRIDLLGDHSLFPFVCVCELCVSLCMLVYVCMYACCDGMFEYMLCWCLCMCAVMVCMYV